MTLPEAKEILGVRDGYSLQEAKSARNRLAKRYHPDLNDDPQAEAILKRVNEAYQLLIDSFYAEQEKMRAKRAAEEEQKRKAEEEERKRKAAERERARRAAEEERKRKAAEQQRYSRQGWSEQQSRNEERERQTEQERQREAAERQWRQRTEEAQRDRAEQYRRQRERWEAMQREEAIRREQERKREEALRRERVRREAERRERERHDREEHERGWDYWVACNKALKAKTVEDHEEVASLFEKLGDYQDSRLQYESHRGKAADLRARRQEMKKKAVPINILSILPTGLSASAYIFIAFKTGSGILVALMWIVPVMYVITLQQGLVKNIEDIQAPVKHEALKVTGANLLVIAFCTYALTQSQALLLTVAAELVSLLGCRFGCEDKADLAKRILLSSLAWVLMIAAMILA